MADKTSVDPSDKASSNEEMFPTLTADQISRTAVHGHARHVEQGEMLIEAGEETARLFVVTAGQIETSAMSGTVRKIVAVIQPGMFTGEVTMLSGRRGLAQTIATEPSEVIEVDRAELLSLVQQDSELGDILMRAFILRRLMLIAGQFGDVVLVGSNHCAGTLRVKEFLTRNGHPYSYIDLDRDDGVQELLDAVEKT